MLKVDSSTSFQKAFGNAIANFRSQYTLGFYPSALSKEGSFHRLEVKLKSQDLCPECRIIARQGYFEGVQRSIIPEAEVPSLPNAVAEQTKDALIQRSMMTAGTTTYDISDVPLTLETVEQGNEDGQTNVTFHLKIDPAGIGIEKVGSNYTCNLRIAFFSIDKKGRVIATEWRRIDNSLNQESYERAGGEGLLYQATIPVKAQNQLTKIVVYDEKSDKISSKLAIPFRLEEVKRTEQDGQPQIKVKIKIDPKGIGFIREKDVWRAYSLKVRAFYSDIEQDDSGAEWKDLEGNFKVEFFYFLPDDIGFKASFPVKEEGKIVKVVVRDEFSGKTASKIIGISE